MIEDVCSYGKGLKPPTYHEIRNTYLKSEVLSVNEKMEVYKKEWKKTGCTIMSDGWTDGKRRSITNFLVNSPKWTVFLKSVDTSGIYKSAENIFKMLDEVVEEIGEENVVQCVTDSAAAYVKAGELLMEKRQHLFWSPCAAHCLDLILEDMGKLPTHSEIVEKCRCITVFIYKHSWVLNLMRTWTKGRELTRPAVTRFATQYLTLQSVMAQRGGLRRMFTSIELEGSAFSRGVEGKKVANIILTDYTFWEGIKYCIKSTLPLVKVLRLVDGDAKPAMGYIYEAMDRAKEQIARNFGKVKKNYEVFWKIIDERWNLQLHRSLHAAGYYLNPQFHYEDTFHADFEVKRGLYDCIERMVSDKGERILIDQQIDYFTLAEGGFGREMAKETRKIKQPAIWWERYGYDCPTLQKFAIRVLSLTCSATGWERNWSVFDQINLLKSELLSVSEKNAELKTQIRELTMKLQLAEQGKDQAQKQFLVLGQQHKAGLFGTVKALRTNPPVIPDESVNPRLASILEKVAVRNELIVALANWNVKDMLEVWFTSIQKVGIPNYLVVALDDETADFCKSKAVPTYRREPDEGVDSVARTGSNHAISGLKFRVLREFLQLGYSILLSDVDIVYLQNPFDHIFRDSDVESMTDGHNNMTAYGYNDVFDEPQMGWARYAHSMRIWVYNSGFFYIRPTLSSIELLDRVADRLARQPKSWDQAVFNEELFFPSHPGYIGLHASRRTMDFYQFMNSKVLFKTVRKDPNLSKLMPVIVHTNYHPDKLPRMKAIVEFYVNGNKEALKPFPDGSEW